MGGDRARVEVFVQQTLPDVRSSILFIPTSRMMATHALATKLYSLTNHCQTANIMGPGRSMRL